MRKASRFLSILLSVLFILSCLSGLTVSMAQERTDDVSAVSVTTAKPVDLAFVIDSTGSMGGYIDSVKSNLTSFVEYLNGKGLDLQMSVIDFKDITEDGVDSTTVHKIDGSNWSGDVEKVIDAFSSIDSSGGGDEFETPTDALNKLLASDYGWRDTSQRFAFVLTDTAFKDSSYSSSVPDMANVTESLRDHGIQVSVVTRSSYRENYSNLFGTTGGQFIDIDTSDYYKLMLEVADWVYDAVNQVVLKHRLAKEGWENADSSGSEKVYVYHYTVSVDVTNRNKLSVSNVNVFLTVPDGLSSSSEKTSLGTLEPGQTVSALFDVTAIQQEADQDLEYSVTVTSDNTANITQYDRIFVEGSNQDNNIFVFGKDTYNFPNYGEKPEPVNIDNLTAMIRNLPKTKQQEIVSAALKGQGGHCYGMSASSILMKVGRLSPNSFDSSADTVYDLPKNAEVRNLISYYQLSQLLPDILENRQEFARKSIIEKLSILQEKADKVDHGGSPFILSFDVVTSTPDGVKEEGHAVVAYSFEKGSFLINGKKYDSRVLVYDNNSPEWREDVCLYFNEGTDEWIIPAYNAIRLTRCLDDVNIMDTANIDIAHKNYDSYLTCKALTKFRISSDSKSWNIDTTSETSYDDIVWFNNDGGDTSKFVTFLDTASNNEAYTITPLEGDVGQSELSLMYDNYYLTGDAESWNSISFDPDDTNANVSINGGSGNFKVSLTANEGYNTLEWPTITASGTDCGNIKLEQTTNGYYLTGDDLRNVTVTGEDPLGGTKSILVDSENNKVFIGEKDGEMTASIDKDGDGVYETLIATTDNSKEKAELKDLQIEKVTLNPAFRSDITDYTAVVDEKVSSVKVISALNTGTNATVSVNDSTPVDLSGNNIVDLAPGKNVLKIKVSGDNLLDTVYTITINRANEQTVENANIPNTGRDNIKLYPLVATGLLSLAVIGLGSYLVTRKKKNKNL